MTQNQFTGEIRLVGIPVSQGFAQGPILVINQNDVPVPCYPVAPEKVHEEVQRLESAIQKTREQLLKVQREVSETLGEKDAAIFEAHLLVLEDATLLGAVSKQLQMKKTNIEAVYNHVATHYASALAGLEDPYLSERANDVRDVTKRVLMNLAGGAENPFAKIQSPSIIFARDLSPSDTAQLPHDKVLGFITLLGSKTSHTAIMARSMDLPAIVGIEEKEGIQIETGMFAILDGNKGILVINPRQETLEEYGAVEERHEQIIQKLDELRHDISVTTDNRRIILSGNIEMTSDIQGVVNSGAEGIGLFRSEFLFANRDDLPGEEEQYAAYSEAARSVKPHNVILRTLDIGGDKLMSRLFETHEQNPFLGVRAIRICLAHPELLRTQLRAMLRACVEGNVRIMYPMISGVEEVRQANKILFEEKDKLKAAGHQIPDNIEIGAMIEIPSAALTADIIAKEVSFFSIGTNDLIQYSIAIDRGNEKLAYLYSPTHPAILRLINGVVQAAHANNIWVGVCGEMASEFVLTPLLLGLGVDELSAGSAQVPRIKRVIRSISYAESKQMVDEILQETSSQLIMDRLTAFSEERFPELFE